MAKEIANTRTAGLAVVGREDDMHIDPTSASRSIYVTGFQATTTSDALIIHFQRRKNGGGEIDNITISKPGTAVITFDSPEVAQSVLQQKQMFEGDTLAVKPYLESTQKDDQNFEVECLTRDIFQRRSTVQKSKGRLSPQKDRFSLKQLLGNGVNFSLYQSDITDERVDAIVNEANRMLQYGGGVAYAIYGGRQIEEESRGIMTDRNRRPLDVGDAVHTSGGHLPCRFVIHTVGPVWKDHDGKKSVSLLRRACIESLRLAAQLELCSIALPAISSGIFGMPKNICAQVMFNAVEEFSSSTEAEFSTLRDVRIVIIDDETISFFREEFVRRYTSQDTSSSPTNVTPQERTSHEKRESSPTLNSSGEQPSFSSSKRVDGQRDEQPMATKSREGNVRSPKKEVGGNVGNSDRREQMADDIENVHPSNRNILDATIINPPTGIEAPNVESKVIGTNKEKVLECSASVKSSETHLAKPATYGRRRRRSRIKIGRAEVGSNANGSTQLPTKGETKAWRGRSTTYANTNTPPGLTLTDQGKCLARNLGEREKHDQKNDLVSMDVKKGAERSESSREALKQDNQKSNHSDQNNDESKPKDESSTGRLKDKNASGLSPLNQDDASGNILPCDDKDTDQKKSKKEPAETSATDAAGKSLTCENTNNHNLCPPEDQSQSDKRADHVPVTVIDAPNDEATPPQYLLASLAAETVLQAMVENERGNEVGVHSLEEGQDAESNKRYLVSTTHSDPAPRKPSTKSMPVNEKETKESTSSIRNVATSNQGIERRTPEHKELTEVALTPAPESNAAARPVKPDEIPTAKQDSKQIKQGSDANNNWRQVQSDVTQMRHALDEEKRVRNIREQELREKETVLINTLQNTLCEEQQARTRVEEELSQARIACSELEVRSRNELAQMRQMLDNEIRLRNTREQELREKAEIAEQLQNTLREEQQARTRMGEELTQARSACSELKVRSQNELQVMENAIREQQRVLEEERQQKTELEERQRTLQVQMEEERNRYVSTERELQSAASAAQEALIEYQRHQPRDWIIQREEVVLSGNILGKGAWGNVRDGTFRCCPVAIKEIHELILSDHNRRLFEREMSIASCCRHPNLLQFIGATNEDGSPLFITELLDTSLRHVLTQRALNHDEIVSLALDVAKGLNYLHLNKPLPIIHRDISSANVLLWRRDDCWRAKLSDYGAANFMRQVMTMNPGAIIYSAPEAFTSQQSPKVDVYSFGLLLCEMCIRELPVPQDVNNQIGQVTNGALRVLIQRCVERDPEERPTMSDVIRELEQLAKTKKV